MTSQLSENKSVESNDSQKTAIEKKRKRLNSDLKGFFKRRVEESQSDKEPTLENREAEFLERAQHLLDARKNNNSHESWYSKKDKETPDNSNKEDNEENSEENSEEIFKDKNQGVTFKESKKLIENMLEDKIFDPKEKKRIDESIKYLKDKLQYTREISSSHITIVECLMQNRRREYETNNRIAIQKIERLESYNDELKESLQKCEKRVEDALRNCEKESKDEDRKANKVQLLEAQIKKYEEEIADRNRQEKEHIQELEAQLLKTKDDLSQSLVGEERMKAMEMQLKEFQEELIEQSFRKDERIQKIEQKYTYNQSLAGEQINQLETINKELKERLSATESMTDEMTIERLEIEHHKNELESQIKNQEKSRKLYEQERLQIEVLYQELQDRITNADELVLTIKDLICVFEELKKKKNKDTLVLTIFKLETSLETLKKYLTILAEKKQEFSRHLEDSKRILNERKEQRPRNLKTALEETRSIEDKLQKIKEIISLAIR